MKSSKGVTYLAQGIGKYFDVFHLNNWNELVSQHQMRLKTFFILLLAHVQRSIALTCIFARVGLRCAHAIP